MPLVTVRKRKRVLVTAGSTWVKIDAVRVLANTATGLTGISLAQKLAKKGAQVTLLLGPGQVFLKNKRIKVIRYCFFEELKALLKKELKRNNYDWAVHSAAVSDYKPKRAYLSKIKSDVKNLRLILVPTEKLVKMFKKIQPKIKLVIFKLECAVNCATLLKRTQEAMQRYRADLAVANTFLKNKYHAYLIKDNCILAKAKSRQELVNKLVGLLR